MTQKKGGVVFRGKFLFANNVNHLLRQSFGVVRQSSGSFQAVIRQSLGNLLCTQKCFHIPDIVLTFQPITSRLCSCDSSAVL